MNIRIFFIVYISLSALTNGQAQTDISLSSALYYQKNYLSLSYQNYNKNGQAILFSFHDHDPRFGNMNFHTHLYDNPFEQIREQYQQINIAGTYYLNKRFAVALSIPYNLSTRHFEEDEPYRLQGLGDIKIGGKYHLYDSKLFKPKSTVQHISTLSIFGKFKTGKYNIANSVNDIDPYLQTGTGSFDLTGKFEQQLFFKRFYLNAAFKYTYKGISYYQMKFGDQYSINFSAEYAIVNKPTIKIHALSNLTYTQKNGDTLENKAIKRPNEYKGTYNKTGFLVAYEDWAFQLSTTLPLYIQYEDFALEEKNTTLVEIFFKFN